MPHGWWEYRQANTVVGVMRFLQLEWHNHERARNAWDIERAEMKAKIAKQEGEVRSAKKLNDQLNKHIRMLEQALTNERKKKSEAAGGDSEATTEDRKDSKGKKSGVNLAKRAYPHGQTTFGTCANLAKLKTRNTIPSSTLTRSSLTRPRPIVRIYGKSRSSTLPNASKRSHIFLHHLRSPHSNSRMYSHSQMATAT
jgi:hypothetical protein